MSCGQRRGLPCLAAGRTAGKQAPVRPGHTHPQWAQSTPATLHSRRTSRDGSFVRRCWRGYAITAAVVAVVAVGHGRGNGSDGGEGRAGRAITTAAARRVVRRSRGLVTVGRRLPRHSRRLRSYAGVAYAAWAVPSSLGAVLQPRAGSVESPKKTKNTEYTREPPWARLKDAGTPGSATQEVLTYSTHVLATAVARKTGYKHAELLLAERASRRGRHAPGHLCFSYCPGAVSVSENGMASAPRALRWSRVLRGGSSFRIVCRRIVV